MGTSVRCFIRLLVFTALYFLSPGRGYKTPEPSIPGTIFRNVGLEYKGPVFLIKETDDPSDPFSGTIVDGGIELVRMQPSILTTNAPFTPGINNIEMQEDPEYFAVLVTPDTVAQSQISRTTTITIPLSTLLIGASARIPWLLALKKENHFDYFKTLQAMQQRFPLSRRKGKSTDGGPLFRHGKFESSSKKYDLLYLEDSKMLMQDVCANILKKLLFLNTVLQKSSNKLHELYTSDLTNSESAPDELTNSSHKENALPPTSQELNTEETPEYSENELSQSETKKL